MAKPLRVRQTRAQARHMEAPQPRYSSLQASHTEALQAPRSAIPTNHWQTTQPTSPSAQAQA